MYQSESIEKEQQPLNDHISQIVKHLQAMYGELITNAQNIKSNEQEIDRVESHIKLNNQNIFKKKDNLNFIKV